MSVTPPAAPSEYTPSGATLSGATLSEPTLPGSGARRSRGASRAILIVTAIIGSLALTGVGISTAMTAAYSYSATTAAELTASSAGIKGINVDADAADVTVRFGSVDQATLESLGYRTNGWSIRRDGDELIVRGPNSRGNICYFWCFNPAEQSAILTLPRELERQKIAADLSLAAGEFYASGTFGEVSIGVSAGRLVFEGSATTLDAEMTAGRMDIDAEDVTMATFRVSAGEASAALSGKAPEDVGIDVTAGTLELALPGDTSYRVDSGLTAGTFNNNLPSAPDSKNRVSVDVAAGTVTLNPDSSGR